MTASMERPASDPHLRPTGMRGVAADLSSDQRAFKNVSWGKAMMWIFILSDIFIFGCFLLAYMAARMSTTVAWPNPSEVFCADDWRQGYPADPDCHHDLRPHQQQRHDGHGRQLRIPP